jgi:hypothetical protein
MRCLASIKSQSNLKAQISGRCVSQIEVLLFFNQIASLLSPWINELASHHPFLGSDEGCRFLTIVLVMIPIWIIISNLYIVAKYLKIFD